MHSPYYYLNSYIIVVFDIAIVYAFRMIHLLGNYIVEWNNRALEFGKTDADDEVYCNKMFEAYTDIMECYEMYIICFQYFVSISLIGDSAMGLFRDRFSFRP